MNLSEFEAWFSGYTEEMTGPPSKKQWARIKKCVSDITDKPTTHVVFRDRYSYYTPAITWSYDYNLPYVNANGTAVNTSHTSSVGLDCFTDLGKQEYQDGDTVV